MSDESEKAIPTKARKGVLRFGNKIRLSKTQQELLSAAYGEPVNPETVEAYNAFVDQAIKRCTEEDTPESRLISAMLEKLPEE